MVRRLKIITGVKRSMKNILMPFEEKILLRKRSLVETVFDYLKNKLMLEHSRHRSFINMIVHIISILTAYQLKPTRPSVYSHCRLLSNPWLGFLDSSDEPEITKMCKSKIVELDAEIKQLSDEKDKAELSITKSIAEKIEKTLDFVKNPALVWKVGSYKQRRAVLNLCFSEPISYDREKKFGTPKLSSIFNVLNNFSSGNTEWWAR